MKLRLLPNSLRLRLRQGDLRQLIHEGACARSVKIGWTNDQQIRYRLALSEATTVDAKIADGEIVISVPRRRAEVWANSDAVGIEAVQETGGTPLRILIEKDFACTDGSADESHDDAFPNPAEAAFGPKRD